MYDHTQAYEAAVKQSHTALSYVDIVRGDSSTRFAVAADSLGQAGGKVTQSYDDPLRRSLDIQLVDDSSTARTFADMRELLDPFVAEVHPYRGLALPSGAIEYIPCGTFVATELRLIERAGSVAWQITAFDTAARAQEPLAEPFYIAPGTKFADAIPTLLQRQVRHMSFRLTPTPWVTPALVIREGELPWTKARALAISAGLDLTTERDGTVVTRVRAVQAAETPVWSFAEGATSDFWEPQRSLSADLHPNVVVVIGTNPNAPCSGIAFDNDPQSPTYRYGPYGEHVRIIRSEIVVSADQATAAARYQLSRLLGPQDEVTFPAIPNAALDVGDTVTVVRSRVGLDAADRMIVAGIDLPLNGTEPMQVTCRRSVLTADEITAVRQ